MNKEEFGEDFYQFCQKRNYNKAFLDDLHIALDDYEVTVLCPECDKTLDMEYWQGEGKEHCKNCGKFVELVYGE